MTPLELLKLDAAYGFRELTTALEGLTEAQAWAVLPNHGPEYLHTAGSIYSIALHVASVKWAYGSICFRGAELRWHDLAERMDTFEPSWPAAMKYLEEGHEYWMSCWENIEDLEAMHPTNWKAGDCPAWKIIQTGNQHDSYHAGQISLLRYACPETTTQPAPEAEDIRQHCRDSKWW